MMKFKTTKKDVNAGYINRICVGYCSLQSLLNYENPVAYTARREGWAADIYQVDENTVIITGYAPFGNIHPGYEVCQRYEKQAEKLRSYYFNNGNIYKLQEELKELIKSFIAEVVK